ncbi:MAG: hypothetical protein A4E26_00876 [Methanobacterium sp. PtaU1.Bin097]|nr:MAG: hypothetical protein A4E26_00876 [Methanobacterium sp. PtaU1.Bin097]
MLTKTRSPVKDPVVIYNAVPLLWMNDEFSTDPLISLTTAPFLPTILSSKIQFEIVTFLYFGLEPPKPVPLDNIICEPATVLLKFLTVKSIKFACMLVPKSNAMFVPLPSMIACP